jgi:two-component system alkaline phosphatase synthesis response regulator PhoP
MGLKRVLAVENNELVLSFLEDGLTAAGYDVDTASNGREALEKIAGHPYDLVVSDLHMPELDGFGLCRALEVRQSDVLRRILLISNADWISEHEEFLARWGVPTLTKPVSLEELAQAVERMVHALEPAAVARRR